jgi:hypothetical protein
VNKERRKIKENKKKNRIGLVGQLTPLPTHETIACARPSSGAQRRRAGPACKRTLPPPPKSRTLTDWWTLSVSAIFSSARHLPAIVALAPNGPHLGTDSQGYKGRARISLNLLTSSHHASSKPRTPSSRVCGCCSVLAAVARCR